MKFKSTIPLFIFLMATSAVLFGQEVYLLDSLFSRSVVPAYDEDSIYYEYDESNRKIKENNKYFYKTFSYGLETEITNFYSTLTDEKIAERVLTIQIEGGSGYETLVSNSYENGISTYKSFDTTYYQNNLPIRNVFWQIVGSGDKELIFEINSIYEEENLVSSTSISYNNELEVVRMEEYSASYEDNLLMWEANSITSAYSVSTMDSTIYLYENANEITTILKSYRNNGLSYCVKNRTIKLPDYEIRTAYESNNGKDYTLQDSVVSYFSSFPIVDCDSIKSYRFIEDQAVKYRFETNTLFFDEELLTVEVYNEHFFSNRLDGEVNEINSSNRFYSLAESIETVDAPAEPEWMMYPNPANSGEGIQIEMRNFESSQDNTVKIYDMQGQLVQEFTLRSSVARMPSLMNSGLYYIQLSNKSLSSPEMKSLLILD